MIRESPEFKAWYAKLLEMRAPGYQGSMAKTDVYDKLYREIIDAGFTPEEIMRAMSEEDRA